MQLSSIHMEARDANDPTRSRNNCHFTAPSCSHPGRTTVRLDQQGSYGGFFTKVLAPFIEGQGRAMINQNFLTLKEKVESR